MCTCCCELGFRLLLDDLCLGLRLAQTTRRSLRVDERIGAVHDVLDGYGRRRPFVAHLLPYFTLGTGSLVCSGWNPLE